jgi:hypothetical protein
MRTASCEELGRSDPFEDGRDESRVPGRDDGGVLKRDLWASLERISSSSRSRAASSRARRAASMNGGIGSLVVMVLWFAGMRRRSRKACFVFDLRSSIIAMWVRLYAVCSFRVSTCCALYADCTSSRFSGQSVPNFLKRR